MGSLNLPPMIRPAATRRRGPLSSADQTPVERVSNFFLTFNTNWYPHNDVEYQLVANDLMNAARQTIGNRYALAQIIVFRDGLGSGGDIKHVSWEGAVEQGKIMGYVHMHAILRIRHTVPGRGIHLNLALLKRLFRQAGQTPPVQALPHMNVQAFPDFEKIRDYILKNQVRDKQRKDKAFLNYLGVHPPGP